MDRAHFYTADLRLVNRVLSGAWLRESPMHGECHWHAVTATGLDLVAATRDADAGVVFLFGLLHDTRRENEGRDPEHGLRAADYARELHDVGAFSLEVGRLQLLCHALQQHAKGETSDDPTVGNCWDADRLHLPRVGYRTDPALLSTSAGREPTAIAAARFRRAESVDWPCLIERLLRQPEHGTSVENPLAASEPDSRE